MGGQRSGRRHKLPSHIDKYDIHGNKTKELLNLSYKNALTMADYDLNNNWEKYVKHFIKTV